MMHGTTNIKSHYRVKRRSLHISRLPAQGIIIALLPNSVVASCAMRSHVIDRGNLEITSKFKKWNWDISTGRTVGYLVSVGIKTDGCVCWCMLTMH